MWKAVGDAARASARFARRHRRAIVVGGVVGAAACAYYRMKRALEEAEGAHQSMMLQAGEEARYRQSLARTRGECAVAIGNFLPTLKKRLFLAVDVTGPVRELKALRGASAAAGGGGNDGGGGGGSGGGRAATSDGSLAGAAGDVDRREVELWEQVKVTALTRLVVSLYAFSALALMLHMQLHILGRLSFEESLELLRRTSSANNKGDEEPEDRFPGSQGHRPAAAAATAAVAGGAGSSAIDLSMMARRALLSATYEHVLGGGLRELVSDVERAVARCTSSWQAHTRQEVKFKDLVTMLRRVRREVEDGGIGGTTGYAADDGYDGCSRQSSGASHALLLRYTINPSPDGVETHEHAGGALHGEPSSTSSTNGTAVSMSSGSSENVKQGVSTSDEADESGGKLRGLGSVLNETWDTAESPTFALALQSCLDATFNMVYEQLRQKAFCRGAGRRVANTPSRSSASGGGVSNDTPDSTVVGAAPTPPVAEEAGGGGPGGGRAAASPDNPGEIAAAAAGAAAHKMNTAFAAGERDGFTQVLATVISQVKLVVIEILEPSPENEYAQAIAALPAVQDLCISVFSSGRPTPTIITTTTNNNNNNNGSSYHNIWPATSATTVPPQMHQH